MGAMVDWEIEGAIKMGALDIRSYEKEALGPTSLDLRLFSELLMYPEGGIVDHRLGKRPEPDVVTIRPEEGFYLQPGTWVLGSTLEVITLSPLIEGLVLGKSSLARDGLSIEDAGYVDPGWQGRITLEIKNNGPLTYVLYPGQYICQMRFFSVRRPNTAYNYRPSSHYMHSQGPVMSLGQTKRRVYAENIDRWGRIKRDETEPCPPEAEGQGSSEPESAES